MVVGRGKKIYLQLLPKPFWEVRLAGMTDHPKEARLRGEPLDACLEGKKEKAFMPWQVRVLLWTEE